LCGIAALIGLSGRGIDVGLLKSMTNLMRHRGPDDEGYLLADYLEGRILEAGGDGTAEGLELPKVDGGEFNLGLGHRRLSIIDLSPAGHQPMCNEDGSVWLAFSGELYNFVELREGLKGHRFRSKTDAEVLIHLYEELGIEECLKRMVGMWGFVLWDAEEGKVYMVRDRFGIKPLYYSMWNGYLAVASEAKALLLLAPREPDYREIYRYLSMGYRRVSDASFFKHVKQVRPRSYLVLDLKGGRLEERVYWEPEYVDEIEGGEDEVYAERWREEFLESVKVHLRSDVPLGFLLSGGIDSTSIMASSMKLKGGRAITFTARVDEPSLSEEVYVEEATRGFDVERHYVDLGSEGLWEELERLIWHQDEPPDGPSVYAQWCVMKLASKHVKVVLDGQGGDELLAGYHAYIPIYLKELLGRRPLRALKEAWMLRDMILSKLKLGLRVYLGGRKRLVERILSKGFVERYGSRIERERASTLNQALYMDLTGGRLHELLRYEDRNGMAFSVESRVPFLHHGLAELSLSMPEEQKIKDGWTKYVHRNAMKGIIPEAIRKRRRKLGFEVPEARWLRELGERVLEVFEDERVSKRGIFDRERLVESFKSFIRGELGDEYARVFWRALFLEIWFRVFVDSFEPPHDLYRTP